MEKKDKLLLFEYMLIHLAVWFCEELKFKKLKKFNEKNDFGDKKCLLFPYIVCMASHERKLFDIFDYFTPEDYGNMENDTLDQKFRGKIIIFSPFKAKIINEDLIDKKISKLDIKSFFEEKNLIDSKILEGIEIIDEAILSMKSIKMLHDFPLFSLRKLSFLSTEHLSWRIYSDKDLLAGSGSKIPISLLKEERSHINFKQTQKS